MKTKNKKKFSKAVKTGKVEKKRLLDVKKLNMKIVLPLFIVFLIIFLYISGDNLQDNGMIIEVEKNVYFKLPCENCVTQPTFDDCIENLYYKLDSKEVIEAASIGFNNTYPNFGKIEKTIYSDGIICKYYISDSQNTTREKLREYVEAHKIY